MIKFFEKVDDKTDLALYVSNNVQKAVKIIDTTWEMQYSSELMKSQKLSSMSFLQAALERPWKEECRET